MGRNKSYADPDYRARMSAIAHARHARHARHADPDARFWERVDTSAGPEGCWPWTGSTQGKGHGQVYRGPCRKSAPHKAHRVAWELTHGPIPAGLFVCHHCDNPPCCNPAHLYVGTAADNARDMFARGRARPGGRPYRRSPAP